MILVCGFVFNFVRSAMNKGCVAANYVKVLSSTRQDETGWKTQVRDNVTGDTFSIQSRFLINAAGAFVDDLNNTLGIKTTHRHVLSKGIHLIVPRIAKADRVLAFFADDGRLFFAIPMANLTCIGTTDTRVSDAETSITEEDLDCQVTQPD